MYLIDFLTDETAYKPVTCTQEIQVARHRTNGASCNHHFESFTVAIMTWLPVTEWRVPQMTMNVFRVS
jgi:hypothetical protein